MPSGRNSPFDGAPDWRSRYQRSVVRLRIAFAIAGAVCLTAVHGYPQAASAQYRAVFAFLALGLTALPPVEWGLSRSRRQFAATHVLELIAVGVTLVGAVVVGSLASAGLFGTVSPAAALSVWWKLTLGVWIGLVLLAAMRRVSYLGLNPAAILVLSFASMVMVGTLLLMLPRATAGAERAPLVTAFFTATSATCVTGLIVVDTGGYWSGWGQAIILTLFQVGGLGIMTFGAFFALLVGQGLMMSESVLLGDLLEASTLSQIRRLVIAILLFTFVTEAVGAVLLSGLWYELPLSERVFQSVFHSVSGFCNAGFSLMATSFEGYAERWQVWGVLSTMIILGGMGFAVLYNLFESIAARLAQAPRRPLFYPSQPRPRLRLSSRLVLLASALLLLGGAVGLLLFERTGALANRSWGESLAHCWFQSVTARTAGFNTLAISEFGEGAQFFLILLMFVGASPGSTGGGVKTVAVATTALAVIAVLRGREQVEVWNRTIPEDVVRRALLIVALGAAVVVGGAVVLVLVENPARGQFVAYLFEVTSAFATVGLSTGITPDLSPAGKVLVALLMFAGRVGPLTLVFALAGRSKTPRYRYPDERVTLG